MRLGGEILAELSASFSPLSSWSGYAFERFEGEGYGFAMEFDTPMDFSDGERTVEADEVRLFPIPPLTEELNLSTVTITGTGLGSFSIPRVLPETPLLQISREGDGVVLTWEGSGRLESAASVDGPWTEVAGVGSPYEVERVEGVRFYRLSLRF